MRTQEQTPGAGALIAEGLRLLIRPPYSVLAVVSLLIWAVSRSITTLDETGLLSLLFLTIVTAYINIAVILAAASSPGGPTTADHWLRAAVARRTFWRFTFAELAVIVCVLLGAIALIVPALFIGAAVSVTSQSAVLEHHLPMDALRRSLELTRRARLGVGVVFGGLVLIPLFLGQAGIQFGWDAKAEIPWLVFEGLAVLMQTVAVIALTRAFLALGGVVEPNREKPTRA